MKRILITGAGSYIGTRFEKWMAQWPEDYQIETVDMQQDSWKEKSFAGFDAVFHVAGIAHVSTDPSMEELYYKVNRDLTAETAAKAKADGAPLFVFMSSIIVYGDSAPVGQSRVITAETVPTPANFYGRSKLQAEEKLHELEDESFATAIIRPPMIYGPGSKGNYPRLSAWAQKLPVFPLVENERSMLYVDNLCQFLKLVIDEGKGGTFFPQNAQTVQTAEMVRVIAQTHGKKIRFTKVFNPALRLLSKKMSVVNKAFGNLVYDKALSGELAAYQTCSFEESVQLTERESSGAKQK